MDLIRNEDGHYYGSAEELERQKIINQKVSEAKMGSVPWNKGVACSEETKKKIGDANRGKESYWKGKQLPEKMRQKISEAKKGKPSGRKGKANSEESKRKVREALGIKLKCIELNMVFNSGREAAIYLGKNINCGAYILKKIREGNTCYGYHWEIIKPD